MSADVIPFTSPTISAETNRGFKSYKCRKGVAGWSPLFGQESTHSPF